MYSYFFRVGMILVGIGMVLQSYAQEVPAFPTAEGFGKWATGGRGGQVVAVTTLEDRDRRGVVAEGSLRWALDQFPGEPLTVVFKVSGIIDLRGSDLRKKRDNITIAGQTAPGDGICIKGGKVNLGGCNNLIVRHLRFRVGLKDDVDFIEGAALGLENGSNFIIDHCTFGWSGEENMTIYDNNLSTIQWCILHEGLYDSGHGKGARGYGSQWGGQKCTYHHNLLAHNNSRTPRINGAKGNDINVLMDYVNNVNYNWGKQNSTYGGEVNNEGKELKANWINNYYKPGPARPGSSFSYFIECYGSTSNGLASQWHLSGNHMEGNANESLNTDNYMGIDLSVFIDQGFEMSELISEEPFAVPYNMEIESAEEAYHSVMANAGAFPRDSVDMRIVSEVENGTASGSGSLGESKGIIDHPNAVGGFPEYESYNITADLDGDGMADYWEVGNGLDTTNAGDRNKLTTAGYTYLEAHLNGLVGEYLEGIEYPEPVYLDAPNNVLNSSKTSQKLSAYLDSTGSFLVIQTVQKLHHMVIYNSSGKVIKTFEQTNSQRYDITNLQHGLYLTRCVLEDGSVQTTKFLK